MKIMTGEYTGRNIYMPGSIRPSQNMFRKAVFDIIGHDLTGLSFLDLFAGSGAMGIEALSCGAVEVHMVERNPVCLDVIRTNLERLRPVDRGLRTFIWPKDAFAMVKQFAREGKRFDIVFFDPPFDMKLAKKALKTLGAHDILYPHSFVVAQYGLDDKMFIKGRIEEGQPLPQSDGYWLVDRHKVYGTSQLTILKKSER